MKKCECFVETGNFGKSYTIHYCPLHAHAEELREALMQIVAEAAWHYDEDADPNEESPPDMIAHINGIIIQIARRALCGERKPS